MWAHRTSETRNSAPGLQFQIASTSNSSFIWSHPFFAKLSRPWKFEMLRNFPVPLRIGDQGWIEFRELIDDSLREYSGGGAISRFCEQA